jgi:hypothetical protein
MKKHMFLAGSIRFFGIKQLPFLPPNLGLGLSLSSMFNGLLYGGFLSHFLGSPVVTMGFPSRKLNSWAYRNGKPSRNAWKS